MLGSYVPEGPIAVMSSSYSGGSSTAREVEIDELDDYESLPSNSTPTTHMLAGAAAGIMEHCLMYPVDCVKTRMQAITPHPHAKYRNVIDAFTRIVRYEGARMTLRGINVTAYGAGPAHAMYFASYEKIKQVLRQSGSSNHLVHGAAGCCATLLHDAVMNPADVIKQRMQVFESRHKSSLECARTVFKEEGLVAFYRSYGTQLTMNIPYQSLHFVLYEFMQETFNPEHRYNPQSHILSGAFAGAVAAAATTPLDVCKTLLNTQEQCRQKCSTEVASRAVTGMSDAFKTIYQFRGLRGFFAGATARVIYQSPSTAISWSVYEFFKYILTKRGAHSGAGMSNMDYGTSSSVAAKVQVHAAMANE